MREGKFLKESILEFMKANKKQGGYSSREISERCNVAENVARESLVRLTKDGTVFRMFIMNPEKGRKNYQYFLEDQKEERGVGEPIDPSVVSWKINKKENDD
jgi:predicted ArsR family transcriptional regulator|tara:strand:+ start:296 stop:601 length:306 start_codon:yes stop_codon:yes gene_type:complete